MAHITLIEDDIFVRTMLETSLKEAGHDIISFKDMDDINKIYEQGETDLVITDICLPSKNGVEIIREIKQIKPKQTIIAISGGGRQGTLDMDELLESAKQAGAQAVFGKPFLRTDFLAFIDNLAKE